MSVLTGYDLLSRVTAPAALRGLAASQLPQLAAEIRRYLIQGLSPIGGHFAANLGTVELTLALHRALDTPHDRLVWDVGHQAYVHKILTGRAPGLPSVRQRGGLAPFLVRAESEFDAFGSGHAGTAISAAAGMAAAVRLKKEKRRVVAVIGDGGLTAGASFEALNHLGSTGLDILVIGNDNDMSISENVGALRDRVAEQVERAGLSAPHRARPSMHPVPGDPGAFEGYFRSLGFHYHGPIDGHDLSALEGAIVGLRDARGPHFLHVITVKGKGFAPAEWDPLGYHGVGPYDPDTGAFPSRTDGALPTFSAVFGEWICRAAERDPRVVAITPAMREGSGLVAFARRFPDRYFDVGIAEQHAVTLAAGLAAEGLRPVVAIYSTFLQRAYDQLIHDVAIQNLPVVFAIDRAGLVGPDGATHHGNFDLAFLRGIPNLRISAPCGASECAVLLDRGLEHAGPSAIRYPRGPAARATFAGGVPDGGPKAKIHRRAYPASSGRRVVLLALGPMLHPALRAAERLDATVVDLIWVKPLDGDLILDLASQADLLVTIEDHVRAGGVGSAIEELLSDRLRPVGVLRLGLPDQFIEHGTREELLAHCGLDEAGIVRAVENWFGNTRQDAAGGLRP